MTTDLLILDFQSLGEEKSFAWRELGGEELGGEELVKTGYILTLSSTGVGLSRIIEIHIAYVDSIGAHSCCNTGGLNVHVFHADFL